MRRRPISLSPAVYRDPGECQWRAALGTWPMSIGVLQPAMMKAKQSFALILVGLGLPCPVSNPGPNPLDRMGYGDPPP
jgi:hypothetical protein